jgi:hypothetical protein
MYGVACWVATLWARKGLCSANGRLAMSESRARKVGVSDVTRSA